MNTERGERIISFGGASEVLFFLSVLFSFDEGRKMQASCGFFYQ